MKQSVFEENSEFTVVGFKRTHLRKTLMKLSPVGEWADSQNEISALGENGVWHKIYPISAKCRPKQKKFDPKYTS